MGDVINIVIDTREQNPLFTKDTIKTKIHKKGLKTGDYSLLGYEDKISIERKSLMDLFGTLGKGHKRFKKELERAKQLDYFCILIEGSYSSCLNKDFDNSFMSKMKGYVITSILFTLEMKYNIKFRFCNSRLEAKRIIKEIFKAYLKCQN